MFTQLKKFVTAVFDEQSTATPVLKTQVKSAKSESLVQRHRRRFEERRMQYDETLSPAERRHQQKLEILRVEREHSDRVAQQAFDRLTELLKQGV